MKDEGGVVTHGYCCSLCGDEVRGLATMAEAEAAVKAHRAKVHSAKARKDRKETKA